MTPPSTLPARLLELAESFPARVAMRHKQLGRWQEITFAEYGRRAAAVGLGLRALGVSPGDRVAVHSGNRPEWPLSDLGIQGIGAITVGVYPTSPEAEVLHVLADSGTVVLIAEDEEQFDKAVSVRDRLPTLRRIVVVDPRGVDLQDPMVMTFAELESLGEAAAADAPTAFADVVQGIDPASCAIVVYTSGTTGPPKGAMLSHVNLAAVKDASEAVYGTRPGDELLSYLPICHIAERLLSVIDCVGSGYVVNFGEGGDSFTTDLLEVQPTVFLGVPRIWERLLAGVQLKVADASRMKRLFFDFWMRQGRRRATKRMQGRLHPVDRIVLGLGWLCLYRSLRWKLGLSRVRVALSGAAPIAPEVLEFFWALGIPVREAYGQTENTALGTYMPADDVRIGTVGKALPGVELRLADDGEILTRSSGTFMGYWTAHGPQRDGVDGEGWLQTGDVGTLDADGFLTITDRKKDIIVTAGGKNIAPSELENRLKVSPYIREAVVIGDRRPFLSALIGIELDTVGDWAVRQGLSYTTYADLASKPEVMALVADAVERVNADFAQAEEIKQFRLLLRELDHEDGDLTATQKVKRAAIAEDFGDLIEEMYRVTVPS